MKCAWKQSKKNGHVIQHVKKQYEDMCYEAINNHPLSFVHIENTNYDMAMTAVEKLGSNISYVNDDDITKEMCIMSIKQRGRNLLYIKVKYKDEDICMMAVKKDGRSLEFVINQTYDICLEAVKNNGDAIEFVNDEYLTDELIDIAIENIIFFGHKKLKKMSHDKIEKLIDRNIEAIQYFDDLTEDLYIKCVRIHHNSLVYNIKQTHNICLEAVKTNGLMLFYVKDKTRDICIEAIKQNIESIYYVDFPQEDIPHIKDYMIHVEDRYNMNNNYTSFTEEILKVYIDEAVKIKDDDYIKYILYLLSCKYNPQIYETINKVNIIRNDIVNVNNIVMHDGACLMYIKDRDYDMCINAIQDNPNVIIFLNDNELNYDVYDMLVNNCIWSIVLIIDNNYINKFFG
jgi:hypothetical protein